MADGIDDMQGDLPEKTRYRCEEHDKDLVPLLCEECDSLVCFKCVVDNHHGHKMCNISDGIMEKVDQLNDCIQKKESACFDLNGIKEKLEKRQQDVKNQKEKMIQRVTVREEEIVREVQNVCQQTIEQISSLATKIESPMIRDKELLNSLSESDLFQKDTEEECIKTLYFYKRLKLLDGKDATENRSLPFTFVTRDLSSEKINELVGSVMADELLSSDDNVEKSETRADISGTNSTNEEEVQPSMYQKKILDGNINAIILILPERSLLCSNKTLYAQTKETVDKILEEIDFFTYVPNLEEVIFTFRGSTDNKQIWRQPITKEEQRTSFMTLHCDEIVAMTHDDTYYLTVLYVTSHRWEHGILYKDIEICQIDDTGCMQKPILYFNKINCSNIRHFKLMNSSIVMFKSKSVTVCKELTFNIFFSYSGSVGNSPARTFSPIDLCVDPDGNFLVTDSFDSTVHLLDPTGKFMRIIMSAEDGICDVRCVSMDVSGWLRFGCKKGFLRSAYYKHFKDTTREERQLEKMKSK